MGAHEVICTENKPKDWVNGIVTLIKKNGDLRVCLDPRPLNFANKKWDAKVVVKEQVAPRSYVVETPDGVHYRRNRKDLLKTEENISGELDLEMNSNETETVNTQLLLLLLNNSDTERVPAEVPTPIVQLRR